MELFVASYVTIADFECIADDHGYDSMADMAHPNAVAISTDEDKAFAEAKRQLIEELIDCEEIEDADILDFIEESRHDTLVTYRVEAGVDPVATIVIRKMSTID